ncbi:MAG: APC family permease [Candidatus Wallbacteria bacterium]|nr:APC family permease [Candidatus Wallbacteria bacterium]
MSLVALLAWVGLGADGLSSSSYGPDEAWRALGQNTFLAVFLAMATAGTVFIIAYSYTKIIEHFPAGGGGYVVATKLLGHAAGLVSGSALLVDYVLTISISVASGGDAIFSFLPVSWEGGKFPLEVLVIFTLIVLNLRGVKESVVALVPIFAVFVVTHLLLILGGIIANLGHLPDVYASTVHGMHQGMATLGAWGLFACLLHAYSMGAGTYTGIEAVSNGVAIMREPRVATARRTMLYMACSLAFTAAGIILCYLLVGVTPVEGQTMNAVLVDRLVGGYHLGILPLGHWFVVVTLISEAMLLFVAAQTGFIDGPRVMANMALDNWIPRRFASLSHRLTMQDGVLLMGIAALLLLYESHGSVSRLVVMYSINVFLTFSLSQLGMARFWWQRKGDRTRKRNLVVFGTGLVLCLSILSITIFEKFQEGAWLTLVMTASLIAFCWSIRQHYDRVSAAFASLAETMLNLPVEAVQDPRPIDPTKPTAVLLVGGYSGLGVHALLSIFRFFPDHFKNFHFITVGVVDSGNFKGEAEVDNLRRSCEKNLQNYVTLANRFGFPATLSFSLGTDVAEEAEGLCREAAKKYPRSIVFAGQLIFQKDRWYNRFLHNETAIEVQRRLQWSGQPMVVLPVRVLEDGKALL